MTGGNDDVLPNGPRPGGGGGEDVGADCSHNKCDDNYDSMDDDEVVGGSASSQLRGVR